jgi:YbbR domain-containing protein
MKRSIRNLFVRNWGLKVLSLVLAFVLWLALIPEERTFSEKTVTIPLETLNTPAGMELAQKPESSVDVTIRAPNSIIDQISPSNVFAKLDLGRASVYQQEYPLNLTMISIPPGASVLRISPNKVRLKLELTKQIPLEVSATVVGEVKEGYRITKIEVSPARVVVKGPESKVREKDRVTTTPIDVTGLQAPAEFEADLVLPRPELQLAGSRTRARIRVLVEEGSPGAKTEPKKKSG